MTEPGERNEATVDVWLARPSALSADQRSAMEAILSTEEQARLRCYRTSSAHNLFLAGRVVLRTVLSSCADVHPAQWTFGMTAYGKPYIAQPQSHRVLHFNLSHTDGLIACAVSRGREIGIDVENVHRQIDPLELARHAFCDEEVAALTRREGLGRRDYFFSLWTLKEAYIKALGWGLSVSLNTFRFDLDAIPPRLSSSPHGTDWQFSLSAPTQHHKLALAAARINARPLEVQLHWVEPAALMHALAG